MRDVLDLDRYPIDQPDAPEFSALVYACRQEMQANGMFNLDGFVRPAAIAQAANEIRPLCDRAFTHQRRHNVYFEDRVADLPVEHAALTKFETVNRTLCDDQLQGTLVHKIYEFEPLPAFLACVLQKPRLFLMSDPLARVNVMDYRRGETLNWHFDRCLFTTTLLIQAAEQGGEFEYRTNLRTETDPNYDGVGRLLRASDPNIRVNPLAAGTLNVFAGKNTLHRVSTVRGDRNRLVAVYSYYEYPGAMFSDAERIGFYGRVA
jgi:hypothetical protein